MNTQPLAQSGAGTQSVHQLEERVNRLTLINMALWSLIKEVTPLTEEDLTTRLAALDMTDGQPNGRLYGTPNPCPQCGRILSSKTHLCQFCGCHPSPDSIFDGVAR